MGRTCTRCGITKPMAAFYMKTDRPHGRLTSRCMECLRAEARERYRLSIQRQQRKQEQSNDTTHP